VALLGILAGLVWYHFSEVLFWRKLGVLAAIYAPARPMLLAHLVFGFVLAWYPSGLGAARRRFLAAPADPSAPEAA
jgi:hypothetical protein